MLITYTHLTFGIQAVAIKAYTLSSGPGGANTSAGGAPDQVQQVAARIKKELGALMANVPDKGHVVAYKVSSTPWLCNARFPHSRTFCTESYGEAQLCLCLPGYYALTFPCCSTGG